jgi:ATP-dependent HslUV protease ATP-binding subunit HslU
MSDLTPRQIVDELSKYVVGQDKAKRAVAIALRNRYRRQQLDEEMREEVIPKNILMIGPTGVGKTEIARRLAGLANAPMVKVEATKFTEVGYVGRDVDSMVRDLMEVGLQMVEAEKYEEVQEEAKKRAEERLLELLVQAPEPRRRSRSPLGLLMSQPDEDESEDPEPESETYRLQMDTTLRLRENFRKRVESGDLEDREVEVEVEDNKLAFARIFSGQGLEEMGFDVGGMLGPMMGQRQKKKRKVSVAEARRILTQEEAHNLMDREQVTREAVERVEQSGIIFIDEIDKVAGREVGGHGPDVSREGVQRDILPIIEGSTVVTKHGPVRTHHVLFIAAGAFHSTKPSDLIPELQGRMPIRVELEKLSEDDFRRILVEPKNALVRQYTALLDVEGVDLTFAEDGVATLAEYACLVNDATENIGARRLHTIMERVLEDLSFDAPDREDKKVVVDAAYVKERLTDLVEDIDVSRYIL